MKKFILLAVLSFGLLAGCRGGFVAPPALRAEAVFVASSAGKIGGVVSFTPVGNRLRVIANFSGVPPGVHAFQISQNTDCAASEGGGLKGVAVLPAIVADSAGAARLTAYLAGVELGGEGENIIGRSVRIYARPEYADGKSGGVIACAVIVPK